MDGMVDNLASGDETVNIGASKNTGEDTGTSGSGGGSSDQAGAIAGGVVGAVAVGCLLALAVFFYSRRAGATPQGQGHGGPDYNYHDVLEFNAASNVVSEYATVAPSFVGEGVYDHDHPDADKYGNKAVLGMDIGDYDL